MDHLSRDNHGYFVHLLFASKVHDLFCRINIAEKIKKSTCKTVFWKKTTETT